MGSREGRIRACHGCREQKVRCDIQQDLNGRCSRCRRIGLECIKLAPTRRNRQTKAALQRELDYLKQQFQGTADSANVETPRPSCRPQQDALMLPPPLPLPSPVTDAYSTLSGTESFEENTLYSLTSPSQSLTLPRILDDREYDAQRIDDCFTLFFKDYAPILPVLDPALQPNACYEKSPFLFWTVVAIGCRRYAEDPTMLEFLGPRIIRLALASSSSSATPIHTIQGLLLFCTWPAPLKSMTKDMVYVTSGAAMHLAMQIGLHIPGVGQDFAPDKLHSDLGERMFRDRLWLLTCIVCQATSYSQGLPPIITVDFLNLGLKDDMMVSDQIRFHRELHRIQATAMGSLMRQALMADPLSPPPETIPQPSTLNLLIMSFNDELNDLALEANNQQKTLYLNCGRLHINTFYLFSASCTTQDLDYDGLVELYSIAYKVINGIKAIFYYNNATASCPAYVHRTMILAAFIILKISRSCLAGRVDLRTGEKAYFTTIVSLRESSLENDDIYARGSMILKQLWTSTRVFRGPDGVVDGLSLRIRTRLSMSVVFDCVWWWREEFQGKISPYNNTETQKAKRSETPVSRHISDALPSELSFPGTGQQTFAMGTESFPDYDWAASFDFSSSVNLGF